jgi:hypothetical protein
MIHITEKKLVAAIQIALVGECENTDRTESKLLHDIKALSIADVSPRYSISLVYVKNIFNGKEIALRSFITDANSEEEALGKALIHFTDEMKNYNLSNKVVLKHN